MENSLDGDLKVNLSRLLPENQDVKILLNDGSTIRWQVILWYSENLVNCLYFKGA